MAKTAVCIVNWNNASALLRCLEHIYKQTVAKSLAVFVVDNNSNDGSQQTVTARYPDLNWIQLNENTGGSGGFCRGMLEALSQDFDFVWLLDNDAYAEERCGEIKLQYMKDHPEVGALGCKIEIHAEPGKLQESGGSWDYRLGTLVLHDQGKPSSSIHGSKPVDYCAACSLMIRVDALRKAGPFDPSFFLFFDDVEFCLRIKKAGYEVHSTSDTFIRHEFFADKPLTPVRYYYTVRNRLTFFLDRLELSFLKRLFCSFRLGMNSFRELMAFTLSHRTDLVSAWFEANRDYLKSHAYAVQLGVTAPRAQLADKTNFSSCKSIVMVGFRDPSEINSLLETFKDSLHASLMVEERDFPIHNVSEKVRQISYDRTSWDVLRKNISLRMHRPSLAVVKQGLIDCFSFSAKEVVFFTDNLFFVPSKDKNSLALILKAGVYFTQSMLLPLVWFLKSYLSPFRYVRRQAP